ncbi:MULTISPECIES: ribonuclease H-like domain-containing protein [Clostridium]|uniref:ribonuclease H-like domain-containing protein n=1 Tax=Clostridium TaxID=1485 RepID=UPI0006C4B52C|nr:MULTISPECIES: ribonuclease H-like domain-containing protein [Clostridium]CUO18362.1 putative exonuclease [Clostridium disporicum]
MIIRENIVDVEEYRLERMLECKEGSCKPEESIYFDLEHYVYKKPKCIGVFGACVYNKADNKIYVTQYMIENKNEVVEILLLAKRYFIRMKKAGKKTIVTFSGNNDFTVIKYLFNKYNIYFDFDKEFKSVDIQKEYEKDMNTSIGLKKLEKIFEIYREGDVISGSNLAKTFHKVLKDKEYIERMPKEKIETILQYNEQDVVNLYKIFVNWKKYINVESEDEENINIKEENVDIKLDENDIYNEEHNDEEIFELKDDKTVEKVIENQDIDDNIEEKEESSPEENIL